MRYITSIALLLLLLAVGCEDDTVDDGRLAESRFVFMVRGVPESEARFLAITRDTMVIRVAREELAKAIDDRHLFPNGPIARGSFENYGWTWHFVTSKWSLTETAIELCDGTPAMVEANMNYWVDTVGSFCPWSAFILEEILPID